MVKKVMMNLREYQIQTVIDLVVQQRAYLLADMGSGKTAIALHALLLAAANDKDPFLIVAPKRVAMTVWVQEAVKWFECGRIKLIRLIGSPQKRKALLHEPADAYIINYELLPWLAELKTKPSFRGVILDEVTRVKTPNKSRFKALLPLADKAKHVWGLTGTPLSTSLLDLFGQYRMVDKGEALGKFITHYKQQYFYPADPNGFKWLPRKGAEQEIYKRIEGVTLHIEADELRGVAQVFYNEIELELPELYHKIYKNLVKEFVLDLPDGQVVTAENAAVLTGKLTQFTGGGLYDKTSEYHLMHDTKLAALDELLDNLEGQPTLIVYAYRAEAEQILEMRPGGEWLGNGVISDEVLIDKWCAGKLPYMLIHPSSAGHGLNLQSGGHHIIWFGGVWSQEMYRQTNARLARSGQEYPVYVHHILLQKTIDVLQYAVMCERMQMQDNLIAGVTE